MTVFYDLLADHYDELTDTPARSKAAQAFVAEFLKRYPCKSALDVACGTGVYTLPLAKAGVAATGSDLSQSMLDRAAQAANGVGLSIPFVQASMQELSQRITGPFEAILCMGNSLPHLVSDADLDAAVASFVGLLSPGGVLAVQLLNYTRVLQDRERVVGVDRHEPRVYVRFYDFLENLVRFNVLEMDLSGNQVTHTLHETTLRPLQAGELHTLMTRHGLHDIELFGSGKFEPFDPATSQTLLVVGRK